MTSLSEFLAGQHAWVRVDLDILESNLGVMRELLGEKVRVLAVVKADGYGHGAAEVSQAFMGAGAWGLGVCHLEEARSLRASGVKGRILVFSPLEVRQAQMAVDLQVIPTITSIESALALAEHSSNRGCEMAVHVAVETGLGRFGVRPSEAAQLVAEITQIPCLTVEGIYTHLATDRRGLASTRLSRLRGAVEDIVGRDLFVPLVHAAGSGPALTLEEARLDMVRLGTALYGLPPYLGKVPGLKRAWSLRSRVWAIRDLEPGETVGYSGDHQVRRETRLGVVPVGFFDGFMSDIRRPVGGLKVFLREALRGVYHAFRAWRRPEHVAVGDRLAAVVGRVGMQHFTVDVTDLDGVEEGTEVVIPTREVTASSLVPRVYMREEQAVGIRRMVGESEGLHHRRETGDGRVS